MRDGEPFGFGGSIIGKFIPRISLEKISLGVRWRGLSSLSRLDSILFRSDSFVSRDCIVWWIYLIGRQAGSGVSEILGPLRESRQAVVDQ